MHASLRTLLLLLGTTSALCAQRTWVVDRANGPGTDFTDLPPAVLAAAPGDVIRVRPAAGQFYEAPIVTKGLTIVGDRASPPVLIGVLEVRNVGAGSSFAISAFRHGTIETNSAGITRTTRGLVIADNLGPVHLDTFEYGIDPAVTWARSTDARGVLVERNSLVTISHATIWCSNVTSTFRDSTVVATNSFFGGWQADLPFNQFGETLFVQRTSLWLTDCDVIGSDGGPVSFFGTQAIVVCEATIRFSGACFVAGGLSFGGGPVAALNVNQFVGCRPPSGAFPVLYYDPRSTVLGRIGPVWAREFEGPVPAMIWSTTPDQRAVTSTQYCEAGSVAILAAGPMLQHPIAAPEGVLFLDPSGAFVLDLGIADSSGIRTWTAQVPATLPSPTRVPLQAIELTPANEVRLAHAVMFGKY